MYKYLLFDADNTLLDFNLAEKCALKKTLAKSPLGFSDEIHSRYHKINDNEWKRLERGETTRDRLRVERFSKLYDEYGMDGGKYGAATADIYAEELSHQSQLMPEAETVLSSLYGRYGIYIITNGITLIQRRRMAATPIEKYITHSFISEEMGTAKPSPLFFDMVVEYIGEPDRSAYLVIGDSLTSDISGARAAGIDSVWLAQTGEKSDVPTYTVNKLSQLFDIL